MRRGVLLLDFAAGMAAIHEGDCLVPPLGETAFLRVFSGRRPEDGQVPLQAATALAAAYAANGGELVGVLLNDRAWRYAPGYEYLPARWADFSLETCRSVPRNALEELLREPMPAEGAPLGVLHLFEGWGGGPFKLLTDLVEPLASRGIRSFALALAEEDMEPRLPAGLILRVVREKELQGAWPCFDGFVRARRFEEWQLAAAARLLAEEKVDLVHLHAGSTLTARTLVLLRGLPLVVTPHVIEAEMEPHTGRLEENYPYYTPALAEQLRDRFRREAEIIGLARRVLGVSRSLCRAILRRFPIRQRELCYLPGGISPSPGDAPLREHLRQLVGGRPLVSFAGSLNRVKGVDRYLETVARLQSADPQVVCCLAGRPWRDHDPLAELLCRPGLDRQRLHFLGSLRPDEVRELFRASDAVLFPSRYESFGLACLEAMSEGALPVVSAVGGLPEQVTDGVNGRVLVDSDAGLWAKAIQELLQDPARETMRDAARRAAADYPAARSADRLAAVYRSIAAEGN